MSSSAELTADRAMALQVEQRRLIEQSLAALVSGALGRTNASPSPHADLERAFAERMREHHANAQQCQSQAWQPNRRTSCGRLQRPARTEQFSGDVSERVAPKLLTAVNLARAMETLPSRPYQAFGGLMHALPRVAEGTDTGSSPTSPLDLSQRTVDTVVTTLRPEEESRLSSPNVNDCDAYRLAEPEPCAQIQSVDGQLRAKLDGINRQLQRAAVRARKESSKLVGQRQKAEAKNRALQVGSLRATPYKLLRP